MVRTHGPSSRLTINEIAARANVSPSAVSFALNGRPGVSEETRERILEVVRQANWRPNYAAQALSMARVGAIGVVTAQEPDQPLWSASFGGHFLAGVQSEIAQHGVLLILHTVASLDQEAELYERWLGERRLDGVMVINPHVTDPRLTELERIGLPAVVVGDSRGMSALSCVWTDDDDAARLAVGHLAELGHRHVARIGGDPDLIHFSIRERAFMSAATEARVHMHAETLVADRTTAEIVRRLATSPDGPLTAVIVEDLEFAVHLTAALTQAGLSVPGDLSVLAWGDDGPLATLLTPTLTTLRRDTTTYGRLAAEELLGVIGGGERRAVQGTATELVRRQSTGRAP